MFINLQNITWEQALKLQALGFDAYEIGDRHWCTRRNSGEKVIVDYYYMDTNHGAQKFAYIEDAPPAALIAEVFKWLRLKFGVKTYILPEEFAKFNSSSCYWGVAEFWSTGEVKKTQETSEYDAVEVELLDICLDFLLNQKQDVK